MKKLIPLVFLMACQQQEMSAAKTEQEFESRDDVIHACVNTTKYQIKCAPVVKDEKGVELQFCSSGNYAVDQGLWKQIRADMIEQAGYFKDATGKNARINVTDVKAALLIFGYTKEDLVEFKPEGNLYAGILIHATDKERVFLNDKCQ